MAAIDLEDRITQIEQSLSQRIAELEAQVTQLSHQVNPPSEGDKTPWWKKIVGVYKDDPEFEEAARLGREYRESLRPEGNKDES